MLTKFFNLISIPAAVKTTFEKERPPQWNHWQNCQFAIADKMAVQVWGKYHTQPVDFNIAVEVGAEIDLQELKVIALLPGEKYLPEIIKGTPLAISKDGVAFSDRKALKEDCILFEEKIFQDLLIALEEAQVTAERFQDALQPYPSNEDVLSGCYEVIVGKLLEVPIANTNFRVPIAQTRTQLTFEGGAKIHKSNCFIGDSERISDAQNALAEAFKKLQEIWNKGTSLTRIEQWQTKEQFLLSDSRTCLFVPFPSPQFKLLSEDGEELETKQPTDDYPQKLYSPRQVAEALFCKDEDFPTRMDILVRKQEYSQKVENFIAGLDFKPSTTKGKEGVPECTTQVPISLLWLEFQEREIETPIPPNSIGYFAEKIKSDDINFSNRLDGNSIPAGVLKIAKGFAVGEARLTESKIKYEKGERPDNPIVAWYDNSKLYLVDGFGRTVGFLAHSWNDLKDAELNCLIYQGSRWDAAQDACTYDHPSSHELKNPREQVHTRRKFIQLLIAEFLEKEGLEWNYENLSNTWKTYRANEGPFKVENSKYKAETIRIRFGLSSSNPRSVAMDYYYAFREMLSPFFKIGDRVQISLPEEGLRGGDGLKKEFRPKLIKEDGALGVVVNTGTDGVSIRFDNGDEDTVIPQIISFSDAPIPMIFFVGEKVFTTTNNGKPDKEAICVEISGTWHRNNEIITISPEKPLLFVPESGQHLLTNKNQPIRTGETLPIPTIQERVEALEARITEERGKRRSLDGETLSKIQAWERNLAEMKAMLPETEAETEAEAVKPAQGKAIPSIAPSSFSNGVGANGSRKSETITSKTEEPEKNSSPATPNAVASGGLFPTKPTQIKDLINPSVDACLKEIAAGNLSHNDLRELKNAVEKALQELPIFEAA